MVASTSFARAGLFSLRSTRSPLARYSAPRGLVSSGLSTYRKASGSYDLATRIQDRTFFPADLRSTLQPLGRGWVKPATIEALVGDFDIREIELERKTSSPESIEIKGWWIPGGCRCTHTVIFFGGNDVNRGNCGKLIKFLRNALSANIIIFDYRGLGGSGGVPRIDDLFQDATAIFDHATTGHPSWPGAYYTDPKKIIVMGASFGAAIAFYLASQRDCEALMTIGGWSNLALGVYGPEVPTEKSEILQLTAHCDGGRLDNLARIKQLKTEIFIAIHGGRDLVILPQAHRDLVAAAQAHGIHTKGILLDKEDHAGSFLNLAEAQGLAIEGFLKAHSPVWGD